MVTSRLEPEVELVLEQIDKGQNFLLSGGAGSGKTYSLVQVIKEIIKLNPITQIACMTYTNAAVKEIVERVNHKNLHVSTIHDFLWAMVSPFQKELKDCLIELINDPESSIPNPDTERDEPYANIFEDGISYKEHLKISRGEISHDEVLLLSNCMYAKHKLLCDILKDKFKFIFVDEYQDTSPFVIDILLNQIRKSPKKNIVGFFGDSMQAIYDPGIGDLFKYIESGMIKEVQKSQNRRNPQSVIDLANKLRTDTIGQEPSSDINAPNMIDGVVKQGSTKFLYSIKGDLNKIRSNIHFDKWDFSDNRNTKELNLTHNLIASKAGFEKLMDIYDKDPIIGLKTDIVKRIKKDGIVIKEDMTFEEVIEAVPIRNRKQELKIDLIKSVSWQLELYNQIKDKPFNHVRKIYLNKDSLIDDKKDDVDSDNKKGSKRDNLIKHLFKIQDIIFLYESRCYNEFIKKTDYRVTSTRDKKEIKKIIDHLKGLGNCSIKEVIDYADTKGLCKKDDRYTEFIKSNQYLSFRVDQVKFSCFQKLYSYLEGSTPFSTQHKVKGTEYSNVFVILDNGNWNNYNFARLFGEGSGAKSVLIRTQKIFYVCCTRAKDNLIVYYDNPSQQVIESARVLFGKDNVHSCD